MKYLLLLLLALPFLLPAGKLEDFQSEYDFIRVHASGFNRKRRNREKEEADFRRRVNFAMHLAMEIEVSASEAGLKDITIGADFREYASCLRIMGGSGSKANEAKKDTARQKINQQLAILKRLKFSVEERQFSRQELPGEERFDVLLQLEKTIDQFCKAAEKQTRITPESLRMIEETKFRPFLDLASETARKARRERRNLDPTVLPDEHAEQFTVSLKQLYLLKIENQDRKKRGSQNKKIQEALKRVRYCADLLRKDIASLRKSGFEFFKANSAPYDPARSTDVDHGVPPPRRRSGPVPASGTGKFTIKDLDALKLEVYQSEAILTGISEECYQRYRRLLTPAQAREMDSFLRKALDEEYPAHAARACAVRKTHALYFGKPAAYTAAELDEIMKRNETNQQGAQP